MNDKREKALREFEQAHKKWMNTPIFREAGKAAKEEMDHAREIYESAVLADERESDYGMMQREVERRDVQTGLIHWLQSEKYRVLMHRHNGIFRAVDEAYNVYWEADTLERLLESLRDPKCQPIEKAP